MKLTEEFRNYKVQENKSHMIDGAKQSIYTTILLTFGGYVYVPSIPKNGEYILMINPNNPKDRIMFDAIINGNRQLEILAEKFIKTTELSNNPVHQLMAKSVEDTLNGQNYDIDMKELLDSAMSVTDHILADHAAAHYLPDVNEVYRHVYEHVLNDQARKVFSLYGPYQDPDVLPEIDRILNETSKQANMAIPSKKL